MKKRLQHKFIDQFGWLVMWFLNAVHVVAGSYPAADTCLHPEPPIITGSAREICRNELVTLTATGCTGTVVWSNGDTGNVLTIKPQQTTKYTAICRAKQGCISCFAEVWKVTVNAPAAPVVTPSAQLVCPDQPVALTASACNGTIRWIDQGGAEGTVWTGKLQQTTIFQATCEQNHCLSNPSIAASVQVAVPVIPAITVDKREICAGQPVRLTASGCIGRVLWTDGAEGIVHTAMPVRTTAYRATCRIGSCQSAPSEPMNVSVRPAEPQPALLATVTNGCPFQTADLSNAVPDPGSARYYAFRTAPSIHSVAVESPGAVVAGTYYVFSRNQDGCYSEPAAVSVTITPCAKAIPPCLSNPTTVAVLPDSLDWAKGTVQLRAQVNGMGSALTWQSDGGGIFTDTGVRISYRVSEMDRQRGAVTFTVTAADPDGNGPCVGASGKQVVTFPTPERIGLSMTVAESGWIVEGAGQFVDLTYQLTVVNMGTHQLTNIKIDDNLDTVFSDAGALIKTVTIRSDNSLIINRAYTGRGADTTLIEGGTLSAGSQAQVWVTVRLDVSRANLLTFSNTAIVQATDAAGKGWLDRSTSGTSADPDQNGNPGDNNDLTIITLHSAAPEQGEIVFIPEGFSPNGDGTNDLFVIQHLPIGIEVSMEIYNRWGNLVYQNDAYRNDWDGTANRGIGLTGHNRHLPDGTYYYQIRLSDGREFVRFLTLAR